MKELEGPPCGVVLTTHLFLTSSFLIYYHHITIVGIFDGVLLTKVDIAPL